MVIRLGRCQCTDRGCPVHEGKKSCDNKGAEILYRTDMHDETGTVFCEECASDAFDSGIFTSDDAEGEDFEEDQ